MINNELFASSINKALKKQNIIKKKRDRIIQNYLSLNLTDIEKDATIDIEEAKSKKGIIKILSEDDEQIEFVSWFKKTYPGVIIACIWNGGSRTPRERSLQMLMGLYPGFSDLIVTEWDLFIEMKKTVGGVQSEVQKEFEAYIKKIGKHYILGIGTQDAKIKVRNFVNEKHILL